MNMNILLNKKIDELKRDIIPADKLKVGATQGDSGLILCYHPTQELHGLFADMGRGDYYNVTGWIKNES
jgi:hypothetical protein